MLIKNLKKFLCVCLLMIVIGLSTLGAYAMGHEVYALSAKKIAQYVKMSAGKKRVIMIYTSWCPYCRSKMPEIIKIEKNNPGSIIAISEDSDAKALSSFIKKFPQVPFEIILNETASTGGLQKKLAKYGISPWSSYPTFILLDENNQAQGQGNYEVAQIKQFLGE